MGEKRIVPPLEFCEKDFPGWLLNLAANLVDLPAYQYEQLVREVLAVTGGVTGAERISVYFYDFERGYAYRTHFWCEAGKESEEESSDVISLDELRDVLSCHLQGKEAFVEGSYSKGVSQEDTILKKLGNRSPVVLFPLKAVENEPLGFVCLEQVLEQYSSPGIALADFLTRMELYKRKEDERLELRKKYVDLIEQTSDWVWEVDEKGYFSFVNSRVETITGYKRSEMLGKSPFCFMEKTEAERVKKAFNEALENRQPIEQLENRLLHKNGQEICFETSGMPVYGEKGRVKGFRGISREVTERDKRWKKMEYLSMHDKLTGLYNRAFFEEELRRLDQGRDYPITIIYVDVNNMKLVNDAFGHEKGDELLKRAAEVLQNSLRKSEVLARVGGDEFVALLPGTGEEIARTIVSRIRQRVEEHNRNNELIPLNFSMGRVTAESCDVSLWEMLKAADDLMYRDKLFVSKEDHLENTDKLAAKILNSNYLDSGRSKRLAQMCRKIGGKLSLSREQLSNLDLLVKAHNLGKAGIPKSILHKQGKLNREEQNIIYLHPEKGYRIALTSSELAEIADLILKHHEWWDGNGYPLGLKGAEIPLECRILSVVDAFSAMTEGRVYKEACSVQEAVDELKRHAGSQFDPEVVEAFCELYEDSLRFLDEDEGSENLL